MLFQVLCGFEPIFYTTHPNEEPDSLVVLGDEAEGIALIKADIFEKRLNDIRNSIKQEISE